MIAQFVRLDRTAKVQYRLQQVRAPPRIIARQDFTVWLSRLSRISTQLSQVTTRGKERRKPLNVKSAPTIFTGIKQTQTPTGPHLHPVRLLPRQLI